MDIDGQLCRFLLGSPGLPSTEIYRAQTIQTVKSIPFDLGIRCSITQDKFSKPYERNLVYLSICSMYSINQKLFFLSMFGYFIKQESEEW